jgi:hypothetical protein
VIRFVVCVVEASTCLPCAYARTTRPMGVERQERGVFRSVISPFSRTRAGHGRAGVT